MAKTDIEIAQEAQLLPIVDVAKKAGLTEQMLEPYGYTKAKVDIHSLTDKPQKGKLILVSAINPTPAGEGKTTTSVGLADAMNKLGHNTLLCLREPSLGPVFGIKGGAAGGGHAQVVPMEDINLHFTGDFHAIGAANNLCAALLDNHVGRSPLQSICHVSHGTVFDHGSLYLVYSTYGTLAGSSTITDDNNFIQHLGILL